MLQDISLFQPGPQHYSMKQAGSDQAVPNWTLCSAQVFLNQCYWIFIRLFHKFWLLVTFLSLVLWHLGANIQRTQGLYFPSGPKLNIYWICIFEEERDWMRDGKKKKVWFRLITFFYGCFHVRNFAVMKVWPDIEAASAMNPVFWVQAPSRGFQSCLYSSPIWIYLVFEQLRCDY